MIALQQTIDPWRLEIVVVRNGSHTSAERRGIQRDLERGLLLRLRKGAYVERAAFDALDPREQHLVRMRAVAASSDGPIVFSHWSAAVALGLPVLWSRLTRVHVTVSTTGGLAAGIAAHRFALSPAEVIQVHDLLVTTVPRTVVDVAGAASMEEGVMVADSALHAGLPRELLEHAVDLAGPRQSFQRIEDVIGFAHPAAESAIESRGRVTMLRLGVEVAQLQRRFDLPSGGRAHPDFWFPEANAAAEADGDVKYVDPAMAPDGGLAALREEKRREDDLRSLLNGLARFGWLQSASAALLRPVLARAGVRPQRPRPELADWCAAARDSTARFVPQRGGR